MLSYILIETNTINAFEHHLGRRVRRDQTTLSHLVACILSQSFGFGIAQMKELSDLGAVNLENIMRDFIRFETLDRANEIIGNYLNKLPIFKAWNLLEEELLADVDGQKTTTRHETIQSRHSKKYFGKGKGISVLSLVTNFYAANVKNIGLNEYEAHHLFEMIYTSKSEVEIDSVTGDGHSINKLNYLVLDAIGVNFMPNIKNLHEATQNLYCVRPKRNYKDIITPKDRIKVKSIRLKRDEIVRVLLSLITQEHSQSTIISKLNSQEHFKSLKDALNEYNKIYASKHVLSVINNPLLRQAMQIARNRTESYHQMQKIIRTMYKGVYKGRKISDHKITSQAVRFTSNTIVAYNAIILNRVYLDMLEKGEDEVVIKRFLRISPIAWSHINLTGKYIFNKKKGEEITIESNIAALMEELEKQEGFETL